MTETTIVLFNKPFGVLTQFTDSQARPTLKDYIPIQQIYPIGRLDKDSEGLLVLTNNGRLQHQQAHPKHKAWKTYWVQVEGCISDAAIQQLRAGIQLKDGLTRPAKAETIDNPDIWPRTPPIRYRPSIPDSWVEIRLCEGKNRQIRRMTAAVGFPTLRLIRVTIGPWHLNNLQPGEWLQL